METKYNFTISGNSLLMQRTPISEDTQYKAISFKSPSLVQDNDKIKLFESGWFQTSLRFIDFGLIDGIAPTDLQDAKDKLLALIGTISEGSGGNFIPLSGTTAGNPVTGNIEIISENNDEKSLILSKKGTVGITKNPKFSFGRIVNGGINEPKLRILFIDDEAYTSEITCFEVEPSGTTASVRSVIGSHYEGFLEGEEKPLFRIASFLKDGNKSTRIELGEGGNEETDIFLERWASWAFALVMGGSPKVIFYPDSILRQPGVVDAFQQTPIGQVVATPNPDVKKLFYREGKGLVELGGDGIEKPLVNNNSYSTTETLTGGTWIDGKPIYRQVIEVDVADINTNQVTNVSFSFTKKVKTLNFLATIPSSLIFEPINELDVYFIEDSSENVKIKNEFNVRINEFDEFLEIYNRKATTTNASPTVFEVLKTDLTSFQIIVEYTKTTD